MDCNRKKKKEDLLEQKLFQYMYTVYLVYVYMYYYFSSY